MEDPSFDLTGIHSANVILNYFYLDLLMVCFIFALGNHPQGSEWFYTLAFKGLDELTQDKKGVLV